jgi:hypothetical protein
MNSKQYASGVMLLLLLVPVFSLSAADSAGFAVGTGMWLRFHHGPSTFQLAPGASVTVSREVLPDFRLGGKLISGALFGTATGLEVSFCYAPRVGLWMPGIGIALQGVLGSSVFYYHSGTEYLDVAFPEWSAGVRIQPLRFWLGSFGISTLEFVVGTDLVQFGKILLLDLELFRVFINLGRRTVQ